MIERLKELLKNSYSPYSHFPVSAIVVMKDGKTFSGVNIENASYGATICAERSAICAAVSAGYQKGEFLELHVMVGSGKIGTPCFLCRQVISELFSPTASIYCYSTGGEVQEFKVEDLCVAPFGSEDLL